MSHQSGLQKIITRVFLSNGEERVIHAHPNSTPYHFSLKLPNPTLLTLPTEDGDITIWQDGPLSMWGVNAITFTAETPSSLACVPVEVRFGVSVIGTYQLPASSLHNSQSLIMLYRQIRNRLHELPPF